MAAATDSPKVRARDLMDQIDAAMETAMEKEQAALAAKASCETVERDAKATYEQAIGKARTARDSAQEAYAQAVAALDLLRQKFDAHTGGLFGNGRVRKSG